MKNYQEEQRNNEMKLRKKYDNIYIVESGYGIRIDNILGMKINAEDIIKGLEYAPKHVSSNKKIYQKVTEALQEKKSFDLDDIPFYGTFANLFKVIFQERYQIELETAKIYDGMFIYIKNDHPWKANEALKKANKNDVDKMFTECMQMLLPDSQFAPKEILIDKHYEDIEYI